jgi:hypothetical protein
MANVIAVIGIITICALCYPAWLALIWRALPVAAHAQARIADAPQRCFWAGLLALIVAVPVVLILLGAGSGVMQLLGYGIALAMLAGSSIGAAGLAAWIGRIPDNVDRQTRAVLNGALLLEGAVLLPVFGWLIALPVSLCVALGATLLARNGRRAPSAQPPIAVPSVAR